jgi:hypothetical protein
VSRVKDRALRVLQQVLERFCYIATGMQTPSEAIGSPAPSSAEAHDGACKSAARVCTW